MRLGRVIGWPPRGRVGGICRRASIQLWWSQKKLLCRLYRRARRRHQALRPQRPDHVVEMPIDGVARLGRQFFQLDRLAGAPQQNVEYSRLGLAQLLKPVALQLHSRWQWIEWA